MILNLAKIQLIDIYIYIYINYILSKRYNYANVLFLGLLVYQFNSKADFQNYKA